MCKIYNLDVIVTLTIFGDYVSIGNSQSVEQPILTIEYITSELNTIKSSEDML